MLEFKKDWEASHDDVLSNIYQLIVEPLRNQLLGDTNKSESTDSGAHGNDTIDWDDYDFLDRHEAPNEFSIDVDTFDRLEKTIGKQFQLMNEIDNKAKSLAQYTALLVSIILTALSLLFHNGEITSLETTPIIEISFSLGITSLFLAILQSIHTYLSSVIEYGISGEFAEDTVRRRLDRSWYLPLGIIAYSNAVKENIRVINTNARRFRWAAFLLAVGLLFIFLSAYSFIFQPSFIVELGLFIVCLIGSTWYLSYIYREEYLVVERKTPYNE